MLEFKDTPNEIEILIDKIISFFWEFITIIFIVVLMLGLMGVIK